MDLLLWRGYKVYSYDEDNGIDYVGDFLEKLAIVDEKETRQITRYFIERLEKGIGLPSEWTRGQNPKLKDLGKKVKKNKNLWEYRGKSKSKKLLIRIYFGADKPNKKIVLLDAHFKKDNKHQKRELETVRKRWQRYKEGVRK